MDRAPIKYQLLARDGEARAGRITIAGQEIETPIFMPVGTNATVKAITVNELKEIGYQLILGNTYHLNLRPGDEIVRGLGGLHKFMNWDRAILTDSGGFQVFSLGKLNRLTEEGVSFQSHLDGKKILLTPEKSIQIQENLGSNIMMVLDECLGIPTERKKVEQSIALTTRWAVRSLKARKSTNSLFAPILPQDKPRYLMGVGDPVDLLEAVERGIDMFDCVLATRNARNGGIFTFNTDFHGLLRTPKFTRCIRAV